MKKIISLLVATALSMTAFASLVSANSITSSNKATLAISCVEIDEGDALEAVQEFAAEAELEDYSYYRFTITAGNLPALAKNSTKYTGEGITYLAARINITSEGEYESDWNLAAPAGKGTFTASGDTYTLNYSPAGDACTLIVADNISLGDSKPLATFDMVINNAYSYNVAIDTLSNMQACEFANATKSKGTNKYNVAVVLDNLSVDSTPIALNSSSEPEEPGIDPVEEVAAAAQGAALTDLDGNAVALDADYGIAKFDTAINTGLYNYFIVAKTATATSDPMAVDFSGALEVGGKVSFYALVKSTHGAITSLKLQEVEK